jgi:hypothetical protein
MTKKKKKPNTEQSAERKAKKAYNAMQKMADQLIEFAAEDKLHDMEWWKVTFKLTVDKLCRVR